MGAHGAETVSEDNTRDDEAWADTTWKADAPATTPATTTVQVEEHSARSSSPSSPASPSSGPAEHDETLPRRPTRSDHRGSRWYIEWAVLIFGALAIAVVVKTFLFQPFVIPSGSMIPTLEIHDRVLVNKLSYKLHDIHRGDVVVFKRPPDFADKTINDLVKRVIGLPGDTVESPDGKVTINGRALSEPYLATGATTDFTNPAMRFPNCGPPPDGKPGCVVPAGSYLVMGDNRLHSEDGRYFGAIKGNLIVGRVFMRIWPPNRIGFL